MYIASIMTDSGSSIQSILFHSSTMGVELERVGGGRERGRGESEGEKEGGSVRDGG